MARYWFRQKTFGYGATPVTWQGWALTLAVLLLLAALVYAAPYVRDNTQRALLFVIGLPLILVPGIWISYIKTEGGWRWRGGD